MIDPASFKLFVAWNGMFEITVKLCVYKCEKLVFSYFLHWFFLDAGMDTFAPLVQPAVAEVNIRLREMHEAMREANNKLNALNELLPEGNFRKG